MIEGLISAYIVVAVIMSFIAYFDMKRDTRFEPSILVAGFCGIIWPYILYKDLTR